MIRDNKQIKVMSARPYTRPCVKPGMIGSEGAVLIIALVFLLLLAMLATTVMQTSITETKMAGNAQFKEEAFQRVQAVTIAIAEDRDNFPTTGAVGYLICPTGETSTPDGDCDTDSMVLDVDIVSSPSGVILDYWVSREGPEILETIPFRQSESEASSVTSYDAAVFEAHASYDGGDVRLGRAEVVQGVAIKIVSSTQ